jgi:hypothetical protein
MCRVAQNISLPFLTCGRVQYIIYIIHVSNLKRGKFFGLPYLILKFIFVFSSISCRASTGHPPSNLTGGFNSHYVARRRRNCKERNGTGEGMAKTAVG